MPEALVAGWDIGGAHLKVAVAARPSGGKPCLVEVVQVPCALWQGMDKLAEAIATVRPTLRGARRHAVTMTGELVDLFESRADGVAALVGALADAFPRQEIGFYAGRAGLVDAAEATRRPLAVASANWLAGTAFVARRCDEGLFLDIGSTTSDIVPFRAGEVLALGKTDAARLASDELIYTGVTRTPVMAIAGRVPFAGARQGVMAEHFATMADVYRLTGELPTDADQHQTADGRDKSVPASARRLARMLGRDAEAAEPADWRRLAAHLAERQRRLIHDAADRALSRDDIAEDAPLVGAGVGRFLAAKLAAAMGRPYVDFAELVAGPGPAREMAARCAPAAALAMLAAEAK